MIDNPLNNYAIKMADYNLSRNPTAREAILVLCDQERDHYQDAVSVENRRVKKMVIVNKDKSLHYVQFEDTASLLEDVNNLPWTISMTLTGIEEEKEIDGEVVLVPRIPRTDDQILVDGILYTISMVEPANRYLDGIVNCVVYPERSSQDDTLKICRVEKNTQTGYVVYSLIWGGFPVEYSFDNVNWYSFKSYIRVDGVIQPSVIYIRDKGGRVVSYDL